MMKSVSTVLTALKAGISIIVLVLFAACQSPLAAYLEQARLDEAQAASGPSGQVTISIGTSSSASRTLMPTVSGFAVALSQGGVSKKTAEFSSDSGILETVPEGSYDVSVLAYAAAPEAASGKVVVASGSSTLTVAVNQAASVTVPLSWGTFSSTYDATGANGSTLTTGGVKITLKAPVDEFEMAAVLLDNSNGTIASGNEQADEGDHKVYLLEKSGLTPGMYFLNTFSRKNNKRQANWYDTVWVFAGVTTTAERIFTDADYFCLPAALLNPRVLRVNGNLFLDGEYGDGISNGIQIYNEDKSSSVAGSLRTIKEIAGNFLVSYSGNLLVSARNGYGAGPVSAALPWPVLLGTGDIFGSVDEEKLIFTETINRSSKAQFSSDIGVTNLEFQIIQAASRADIDTFSEVWALVKEESWIGESAVTFDAPNGTGHLPFNFEYDAPVVTLLVRKTDSPESIRWLSKPACPIADTVPPTVSLTKYFKADNAVWQAEFSASDNVDTAADLTYAWYSSTVSNEFDTLAKVTGIEPSTSPQAPYDSWVPGKPAYASLVVTDTAGNKTFAGPLEAVDELPPQQDVGSEPTLLSDAERVGLKFSVGDYYDNYASSAQLEYRVSYALATDLPGMYKTTGGLITGGMKGRLDAASKACDWTPHTTMFATAGTTNVFSVWNLEEQKAYKFVVEVRDPSGNIHYNEYTESTVTNKPIYIDSVLDSKITWAVSGNTRKSVQGNFTLPTSYTDDVGDALTLEWSEVSDESGNISLSGGAATVITSAEDKTVTLRATVSWTGGSFTRDYEFTIVSSTKGVISGSLKFRNLGSGDISVIPSAPIKASVNSDMTSPAGSTVTDANGMYSMTLDAASYFVSFESALANGAIWKEANENEMTSLGGNVYGTELTVAVAAGTTTTVNFVISGY